MSSIHSVNQGEFLSFDVCSPDDRQEPYNPIASADSPRFVTLNIVRGDPISHTEPLQRSKAELIHPARTKIRVRDDQQLCSPIARRDSPPSVTVIFEKGSSSNNTPLQRTKADIKVRAVAAKTLPKD